jgi:hypothetical protein
MTSVPVWDKITEYSCSLSVSFSGDVKFDVPVLPPPPTETPEPVLNSKKAPSGRKTPPTKAKESTQTSPKKGAPQSNKKAEEPKKAPVDELPPPPIDIYLFAFLYNGKLYRSNILEKRSFLVNIQSQFTISDLNEIVAFETKELDMICVKLPKLIDDPKKKDKKARQPSASTKKPAPSAPNQKNAPAKIPNQTGGNIEIPKDQQILQALINEEGSAEGIEMLGSFTLDLSSMLFGSKRVSKVFRKNATDDEDKYFSNLSIVVLLKEPLLSPEAQEW